MENPTARRVIQRVRGQPTSDGAGVRLTRVLGQPALDHLDPFLLLDEFRSDRPGDYIAGFPEHPHRGFETVTYMLAGRMRHRDSQGNSGVLGPGGVQWMTAGRGIIHSEMPEQEDGLLWGFQLWVNLPARDKMTAPRYQDIQAHAIPHTAPAPGVSARVIAGRFHGVAGPVSAVATEPLYLDLTLTAGASVEVPLEERHSALVYAYEGAVAVAGTVLERGELAVLARRGDHAALSAGPEGARLLLVAGRPLEEPLARYGPFVMNTQAELAQAVEDFRSGRFAAG